jgi:hypothetical protein
MTDRERITELEEEIERLKHGDDRQISGAVHITPDRSQRCPACTGVLPTHCYTCGAPLELRVERDESGRQTGSTWLACSDDRCFAVDT